MSRTIRVVLLASLTVIAIGEGCGGGAAARTEPAPPPDREVNARGDHEASGHFGRLGGSLELANGFRVEIPAGALESEVDLMLIDGAAANVFHPDEGEVAVGPIAQLTPFVAAASGRTFRVSAPAPRVPAGFDEAEVVLGMEEETRGRSFGDAVTTRWQYHRASGDGTRYTAELAYFGDHRLQFGLTRDE